MVIGEGEVPSPVMNLSFLSVSPVPYTGPDSLSGLEFGGGTGADAGNLWNLDVAPIPYHLFRQRLAAAEGKMDPAPGLTANDRTVRERPGC